MLKMLFVVVMAMILEDIVCGLVILSCMFRVYLVSIHCVKDWAL